jgi:hypothetical protein
MTFKQRKKLKFTYFGNKYCELNLGCGVTVPMNVPHAVCEAVYPVCLITFNILKRDRCMVRRLLDNLTHRRPSATSAILDSSLSTAHNEVFAN